MLRVCDSVLEGAIIGSLDTGLEYLMLVLVFGRVP